jgi:uncharacterized protein (DUF1015 family)
MCAVAAVRPFAALRPLPQLAHRVAAPPYDVVSTDEARQIMLSAPDSFLRVTRPDADPFREQDPDAQEPREPVEERPDAEHEQGRSALAELVRRGVLVREPERALWVYRQQVRGSVQTGIVGLASVEDYDTGAIRVHEHTRPDTEDDRARHLDVLDAHDEPVFLFHRGSPELAAVVAAVTSGEHDLAVTTPDGVWHTLWRIHDHDAEARAVRAFAALDRLYVADGHHRSAAAARLAAKRRGLSADEAGEVAGFLAVIFPAEDLTVLPYHRIVADLATPDGRLAPEDLPRRLLGAFDVTPTSGPVQPEDRRTVGLRTQQGWFRLELRGTPPPQGSVEGLAVSLLQDTVLAPVLGIVDARRDRRLDFVGGPGGLAALDDAVASGRAEAAFALAPTPLTDLVAVSDRDEVMPPKSTWFFPKPASGLLVHPLH